MESDMANDSKYLDRMLQLRGGNLQPAKGHHVEAGKGHVEAGKGHVEAGKGHVEAGKGHVEAGKGHIIKTRCGVVVVFIFICLFT